jgi:hypothetical protein
LSTKRTRKQNCSKNGKSTNAKSAPIDRKESRMPNDRNKTKQLSCCILTRKLPETDPFFDKAWKDYERLKVLMATQGNNMYCLELSDVHQLDCYFTHIPNHKLDAFMGSIKNWHLTTLTWSTKSTMARWTTARWQLQVSSDQ